MSELTVALILLLAALSSAIGDMAIYFINRLSYFKMILAFTISIFLDLIIVLTNAFVLWQVANFYGVNIDLEIIFSILAYTNIPLLFSFVKVLPSVGVGLNRLLELAAVIIYFWQLNSHLETNIILIFIILISVFLITTILREFVRPFVRLLENADLVLDNNLTYLAVKMKDIS